MSKPRGRFARIMTDLPVPADLSQDTKAQIRNTIGLLPVKTGPRRRRTEGNVDRFLNEVAWLIGEYHCDRAVETQEPKTALIREGIEQLITDTNTLIQHLLLSREATGGLLDQVLSEEGEDPAQYKKELRRSLGRFASALHQANRKAETLPNKHAEHERSARRRLAVGLAQTINDILQVRPTTTPGGPFDDLLRLALEEAGSDASGLDRLTRYAIEHIDDPGFRIYPPQKTDQ